MKILLTLFVLLFSSSVLANTNLIGKKLLCIGDHEEAETLENYSFNFISDDTVEVENSNDEEKIENYWADYETIPEYIKVEFGLGISLIINRKTLVLEKKNFNIFIFKTIGTCKVIEGNKTQLKGLLIEEMKKQSKKLKEGNIL